MTLDRPVHRQASFEAPLAVPVAIVGGGACGLVAALALHDLGIEAVVLERDAAPSGSTALSSGFIPAPGTQAQRRAGIDDDSPDAFLADIQAKAHGEAAPGLAAAYAGAIGPALDALESRHGLAWSVLTNFRYPGHSRLRMHTLPQKTGGSLMAALGQAAADAGIAIVGDALVHTLVMDEAGGRVLGLRYRRPDGSEEDLACDALLLACNGFGGNRDMVRELLPEMAGAEFGGHAGNDGSAIAWGRALGARLRDLGGYQGHGSWVVPQGALMTWAVMAEGGVQVNAEGRRFHDETLGYSEAAVDVLAQPGGVAWNVFDQRLLDLARGFPDFREAEAAGALHRCDDVPALARLIGCDPQVLARTLATAPFRAASDSVPPQGQDPVEPASPGHRDRPRKGVESDTKCASLGESSAPVEPASPGHRDRPRKGVESDTKCASLGESLYAVKVTGALFHTQGGLDVADDLRVLRADGTAFPNLFAAGGAAGGVSGNHVWGYLSGNGLLSAVAGGWLAAHAIAGPRADAAPSNPHRSKDSP